MDAITVGHLIALVGLLDLLVAGVFAARAGAHRAHVPGTPLYARARDSRRLAAICAASGLLLIAVALLTPLWEMRLA